jgi:hypothetical protein
MDPAARVEGHAVLLNYSIRGLIKKDAGLEGSEEEVEVVAAQSNIVVYSRR